MGGELWSQRVERSERRDDVSDDEHSNEMVICDDTASDGELPSSSSFSYCDDTASDGELPSSSSFSCCDRGGSHQRQLNLHLTKCIK